MDVPEDLWYFKQMTSGSTVIMGRKTHESIGIPLSNRKNVIVSTNKTDIDGCTVIDHLPTDGNIFGGDIMWVIGGRTIFKQYLDLGIVDEIYVTKILVTFECNVFFPKIDTTKWNEIILSDIMESRVHGIQYQFTKWVKM